MNIPCLLKADVEDLYSIKLNEASEDEIDKARKFIEKNASGRTANWG